MKRLSLKNDVDRRMLNIADSAGAWLAPQDIEKLSRGNLPMFIAKLRLAEAETRRLRKRLEALQSGSERACPECGRVIAGRADAVYCEPQCRIRAYRRRRGQDSSKVMTVTGLTDNVQG